MHHRWNRDVEKLLDKSFQNFMIKAVVAIQNEGIQQIAGLWDHLDCFVFKHDSLPLRTPLRALETLGEIAHK